MHLPTPAAPPKGNHAKDATRDHEATAEAAEQPEAAEATEPAGDKIVGPNYRQQMIAVIGSSAVLVIAIIYLLVTNASGGKSPQVNFRDGALNAGREYATDLATYDYRTMGAMERKIQNESTNQFGNIYSVTNAGLQQAYSQFHTVTSVKINSAKLTQLSPQKATVLVDEVSTTTSLESHPTTSNAQVQISLVRSNKRWLIASASQPPPPPATPVAPSPATPATSPPATP